VHMITTMVHAIYLFIVIPVVLSTLLTGDDREIVDELRYDMRLETTMKRRRRRLSSNHTRAMSIGVASPRVTSVASPMPPPASIRRGASAPDVTPKRTGKSY
jgi:hypothetical protein